MHFSSQLSPFTNYICQLTLIALSIFPMAALLVCILVLARITAYTTIISQLFARSVSCQKLVRVNVPTIIYLNNTAVVHFVRRSRAKSVKHINDYLTICYYGRQHMVHMHDNLLIKMFTSSHRSRPKCSFIHYYVIILQ